MIQTTLTICSIAIMLALCSSQSRALGHVEVFPCMKVESYQTYSSGACNFNGQCESDETPTSCPTDCTCGNLVCEPSLGEHVSNCQIDCQCNENYVCDSWEDEKHCPRDCVGV